MADFPWIEGEAFTPSQASLSDPVVRKACEYAYANVPTVASTLELCLQAIASGVPGDLVECGVAAGAQVAAMGRALQLSGASGRVVRAFDSFVGIPEAGPNDDATIKKLIGEPSGKPGMRSSGFVAHPAAAVQWNMKVAGLPQELFRYHAGWFQDTVPIFAGEGTPIAVLRLDGDLYESTAVCLRHLYDLVPPGGVVIIDDFALTGCMLACEEFMQSRGIKPVVRPISGGEGPVFWRKPSRLTS